MKRLIGHGCVNNRLRRKIHLYAKASPNDGAAVIFLIEPDCRR